MLQDISIDIPIIRSSLCAGDFGLSEGKSDNYEALRNAIEYCRTHRINKLIIPKGIYRFATPEPIWFTELEDFMLDGQGSEFVFTQVVNYVRICHCHRIVIKDLKLDWDWDIARLATLASVDQVSPDAYFDMTFFEVDELRGDTPMDIMNAFDPVTLTPGREDGREYGLRRLQRERLAANRYRFYMGKDPVYNQIKPEEVYLVRHYKYEAEGFIINDTTHISFEQITFYSVPGFAYGFDGDCHHLRLKGCRIMLKPGTNRRVTATADGFHIRQSQGYIVVEDCDFSFMGDDAINIHDNNGVSLERLDPQRLLVKNISRHLHYHVGDPIEFRHRDLSPMGLSATITGKKYHGTDEILLTFDREVPEEAILFNRRYDSSHFIIRNNYFHENRARGVLVHNHHGIIENNRFYKNQGSAIQIETGIRYRGWSEGTGVEDLLVQNNVFDTCDVNDWNHGVIYISTYLPEGRTAYPVFKNLRFLHNHFILVPGRSFIISSAEHVEIRGNVFTNPESRKCNQPYRSRIWIEKSSHIRIEDNVFDPSPYVTEPLVELEVDTVRDVVDRNNTVPWRSPGQGEGGS